MNNLVTVYKSIFDHIDSIVDTNGNKVFQLRAVFNDQIKRALTGEKGHGAYGYMIPTPSVFVEMIYDNELNLLNKYNAVDITFRMHIIMMELDATDGTLDQNLNIFTYRDLINKAFVGFFPTQCGPLRYRKEKQQYNHTNYYEYILDYQSHYIDITALQTTITATASLDLTLGFTYSINN
jgi:hypothetical protein